MLGKRDTDGSSTASTGIVSANNSSNGDNGTISYLSTDKQKEIEEMIPVSRYTPPCSIKIFSRKISAQTQVNYKYRNVSKNFTRFMLDPSWCDTENLKIG